MNDLHQLLEEKYIQYDQPEFVEQDPVSVPHLFSEKENIEIAGFLTATISWGLRNTIVKNAYNLVAMMDNDPYAFIIDSSQKEIAQLEFAHRTFNSGDLHFFISSLKNIYLHHGGLEQIFSAIYEQSHDIRQCLLEFRKVFLEPAHLSRVEKHITDVGRNASAKRLNMFLRWMVRRDAMGVDFGIWKRIPSSALFIPLDIHTGQVSRELGLLHRKQNDWKAVEELTQKLRQFDPSDPVKYDFALFGMGRYER